MCSLQKRARDKFPVGLTRSGGAPRANVHVTANTQQIVNTLSAVLIAGYLDFPFSGSIEGCQRRRGVTDT
jgi:hypothetical protein